MKELKCFVENLQYLGYKVVSVSEAFCDDCEIISVDNLLDEIKNMGIKEVVAEYDESFELVASDGKYIEICGVC